MDLLSRAIRSEVPRALLSERAELAAGISLCFVYPRSQELY